MEMDFVKWDRLSWATLQATLGGASEGILVFDAHGRCRMAGRCACEFFGTCAANLVGKDRDDVFVSLSAACEDPEEFYTMVSADCVEDPARVVGEIELRSPPRVVVWRSVPMRDDHGVVGRIVFVRNVTKELNAERARRHLLRRVELLTSVDALTGLTNRRRFTEEHEREHGRSMRAWDSYAVLRLDIDGMGLINDRFGVPVGDQVLERVAELMHLGRRDYDVVARLVNDEFAILLPGADADAARSVAERILSAVLDHGKQMGDPRPTLCVGVAVCVPPSTESAAEVLGRAGHALHAARDAGTCRIEVDVNDGEADEGVVVAGSGETAPA